MTSCPRSSILTGMTMKNPLRDFAARILPASLFSCSHLSVPVYRIDLSGASGANSGGTTEIRILQLSDLHSNDYGGNDGILARRIREAQPDLIVMTGDIFDKDMGKQKSFANVQSLMDGLPEGPGGRCPVYYVPGNHEFYTDEKPFLAAIASYGAIVLNDEAVTVTVKGRPFVIAGLADPYADLSDEQRKERKEDQEAAYRLRLAALARTATGLADAEAHGSGKIAGSPCLCILLAHRPEYIDDYAQYGFDLIFSGHAHGGQWIIPGKINGVYAVGQGFFPKYAGGLYEIVRRQSESAGEAAVTQAGSGSINGRNCIRFIVSRGLSYQKPAFPRFGNPCELPLVTLTL